MELDAFDRVRTMAQPHDDAVGRLGRDLQIVRQQDPIYHERVVASGREVLFHALKDRFSVVVNAARLPVHQCGGLNNPPAERLADGLMAKAYAKNGDR